MNVVCLEKKGKYIFFYLLYFFYIGIITIEMIGEIVIEDLITVINIIPILKTEIEVEKEAKIEIEIEIEKRTRTKIETEIKIKIKKRT